jgi:hypothetical protein
MKQTKNSSKSQPLILFHLYNRSDIDEKYKKKIEGIIRKPQKTEESPILTPCPYCTNPVADAELQCDQCRNNLPYCILTGYHILSDDLSVCTTCQFPGSRADLKKAAEAGENCPMCSNTLGTEFQVGFQAKFRQAPGKLRASAGPALGKRRVSAKQAPGKRWASTGQALGKRRASVGQAPGADLKKTAEVGKNCPMCSNTLGTKFQVGLESIIGQSPGKHQASSRQAPGKRRASAGQAQASAGQAPGMRRASAGGRPKKTAEARWVKIVPRVVIPWVLNFNWARTEQAPGKHRASAGQALGKRQASTGQAPGKHRASAI